MSDLISRADAIELFEKYKPRMAVSVYEYGQALKSLPSADEQIQSMVEKRVAELVHLNHELEQQLADRPQNDWIPCSERLPSAEDCPMDCMVTRRSKYVGNYIDMAVAEDDGTWMHEDWKAITISGKATCIRTKAADIIAWMPLPKPYREESEVGE